MNARNAVRATGLFACAVAMGLAASGCPSAPRSPTPRPPAALAKSPAKKPTSAAREPDGGASPSPAAARLAALVDALATEAVRSKKFPGAVVVVGRGEGVVFEGVYGARATEPSVEAMTADTIFDLASLTKPMATGAALMVLVDRGLVELDAPAARYLPELARGGATSVTVRHLLLHTSGYAADNPLSDYAHGRDAAVEALLRSRPRHPPGERFAYSDVGYELLALLVERVTGTSLAEVARAHVFAPLAMRDTGFSPDASKLARIAPTERVDGVILRGTAHDPRARALSGVAGHAGVFGTGADVARFARMLLGDGSLDGADVLTARSARAFAAVHEVPEGLRAPGWDVATRYSKVRPERASPRSFGHTGYTGTSLWVDREHDLFVVVLTNRVHPDGRGESLAFARAVGDAAYAELAPHPEHGDRTSLLGVDALVAHDFRELAHRKVGLVTNGRAVAADGRRTVDVLARAPNVSLVRLFSPEHGFSATDEGRVAHGHDEATGLDVVSLYGEAKDPPSAALEGIDTLVVDLQDVGVRFYTYASTLHRLLRVAEARGLRVVVLDRPNPLGGQRVQGPLLATARTFVNHHPLPIEHGLTLGELSHLFAAEEHIAVDLRVVRAEGWRRGDRWDALGLPWIAPSPNLRTVDETLLYPGVALVEAAPVSVGRGTEAPFEQVGAPWVDGARLAQDVAQEKLAGVSIAQVDFTPDAAPFRGETCHGVKLTLASRDAFVPVPLGLALAKALLRQGAARIPDEKLVAMIGDASVVAMLRAQAPLSAILERCDRSAALFQAKRARYLLYPPR